MKTHPFRNERENRRASLRFWAIVHPCEALQLDIKEGLVEVGDDVLDIFDANRKADETVRDADAVADFLGHGSVSHLGGKRDQGLDAAEAFRQGAELYIVEEAARGLLGAEIEGEHGAGSLLLTTSEIMLGVTGEARIVNLTDFGMRVEMARDGHAVGVVLEHADGKGFDATGSKEAVHRSEAGAGGSLNEINLFRIFGAGENNGAASGVAVPIQIFGERVDDDVRAEFDRPLEIGSEEGVVDDEGCMAFVGQLSHGRDVGDAQGGIGGSLNIDHFGVGTERAEYQGGVGRVHKREFEAKVDKELRGQAVDAAIDGFG